MQAKIALGFGNNIDYEIHLNSKIIEDLVIHYCIQPEELDTHRSIYDERDLVISILAFLTLGTGGERFVASAHAIEQFAQRFEKKVTLGGTSVRAAIAMHKFGYTSALHLVTLNDHVRQLLPPDTSYVCSCVDESSFPHLIVQFGHDTQVEAGRINICAHQPNRLIYHSDVNNIAMRLNEDFASLMTEAEVLLISGFNAMQDERLLMERLVSVQRMMKMLPQRAHVFVEDAGYYDSRLRQQFIQTLAQRISIFSLNEDELENHLQRRIDLLDAVQITNALTDLAKLVSVPAIVVHTRYWALVYGEGAARLSRALKAGVTMATSRYCYGDDFTVEQYKEVEQLPPHVDSAMMAHALHQLSGGSIYCVPVTRVHPVNATTVGLGDAFVGGFLPGLLNRRI